MLRVFVWNKKWVSSRIIHRSGSSTGSSTGSSDHLPGSSTGSSTKVYLRQSSGTRTKAFIFNSICFLVFFVLIIIFTLFGDLCFSKKLSSLLKRMSIDSMWIMPATYLEIISFAKELLMKNMFCNKLLIELRTLRTLENTADSGQNDHRKDALLFTSPTLKQSRNFLQTEVYPNALLRLYRLLWHQIHQFSLIQFTACHDGITTSV